jgi:nucleotide-binding universal stress UspA family protein
MAEQGAVLARQQGLDAKGCAVADTVTVADTLVRLAEEHDAAAVAVGNHGHGKLREMIVGSTTREVIEKAPCPALVVGGADGEQRSPRGG